MVGNKHSLLGTIFLGLFLALPGPLKSEETKCQVVSSSHQAPHVATTDTTKVLVIYVKFSDDDFTNSCSGTTDGWNPTTYDTTRPAWTDSLIDASATSSQTEGSLSDYFDEMSFGSFRMIGDIFPENGLVYVPEQEKSYYTVANGRGVSFLNEEILTNLDSSIDYSDYDTNPADGVVDMIFIIFRSFPLTLAYDDPNGRSFTGIATLTPNTLLNEGGTR